MNEMLNELNKFIGHFDKHFSELNSASDIDSNRKNKGLRIPKKDKSKGRKKSSFLQRIIGEPDANERDSLHKKNVEIPTNNVDNVHFSVTSAEMLQPGMDYIIDIWAHLEKQRQVVIERAKESIGSEKIKIQSKGPVKIERGTTLIVRLRIAGFQIDDPEETILWEGEIGNANFIIHVPKDTRAGNYAGIATISVDGIINIAKLKFVLEVGDSSKPASKKKVEEIRYKTAFASYASKDREKVLLIIQGIQKGLPSLDIFMDVLSLRSGQNYEQLLFQNIKSRDIFYLFWSHAARNSEWVEKEWRYAYQYKKVEDINPIPLDPPEKVPPPKELAEQLHFNDWPLIYRCAMSNIQAQ
jgi:hypothetical protein